ncbi:molybdenum ABC transporter ATP-binding protein [Accumulibacter sp.]|uniref:molybdenum ABC transporter ATP-binding protein n=1 Tax=Accumulibacter sp. TaxID=2053492 RepID=UPI002618EA90|nr:molybdenum ABC transporter ATP-binding protein [Accumulibacter sp.]
MSIHARFRLPYPAFTLDIDVDLPAGGVTAVFGRSGSGKTTLLRCIAGLEQTLDGSLIVNGETWQDGSYRRPVHQRALGYVFQEARLFPHLSVAANLDFGRRRIAESERRVSLAQVVELLGIAHLLERRPERLSGGERQRVAIARALATSPRLLLMDEPLAALDQARKQEILPYLERLHDELAIPVLYVSHSPDEVARLADHIVLMEDGRAVAQGPLTETLARVDLPLRLGEDVGVVFSGQVLERDAEWHLARIGFAGGEIWVRDGGAGVGRTVRLRILARDVSIARHRHDDVSIMNLLPATIITHAAEDHPALALLQLQVGGTRLLARLTRHSANRLELAPGQQVWVQIKAVALLG